MTITAIYFKRIRNFLIEYNPLLEAIKNLKLATLNMATCRFPEFKPSNSEFFLQFWTFRRQKQDGEFPTNPV